MLKIFMNFLEKIKDKNYFSSGTFMEFFRTLELHKQFSQNFSARGVKNIDCPIFETFCLGLNRRNTLGYLKTTETIWIKIGKLKSKGRNQGIIGCID